MFVLLMYLHWSSVHVIICSPRFDAVYIINLSISTCTRLQFLSYGLFDMQVEPYHTFDSGDEENYYEEYLKDLG